MARHRARALAAVPVIGALAASGASLLAMGCCMGPTAIVAALTAAGLGALLTLDMGVTVPILYPLVALSLAEIARACWRAHRWFPLAFAVLGAAALLFPFHEALDVRLFYLLAFSGQASLLTAATIAAWIAMRNCRGCFTTVQVPRAN